MSLYAQENPVANQEFLDDHKDEFCQEAFEIFQMETGGRQKYIIGACLEDDYYKEKYPSLEEKLNNLTDADWDHIGRTIYPDTNVISTWRSYHFDEVKLWGKRARTPEEIDLFNQAVRDLARDLYWTLINQICEYAHQKKS